MQTVTAATVGAALVYGMALALFGRLKLAVARRLGLAEGPVRRLLLALHIALVPMLLLFGLLVDLYGPRPVLLGGSAALAVALVGLSMRPTYPHAFASVLLAALGAAALGMSAAVLMPRAFFAPEEASASLNLGYVFVALGSLLAPPLADVLLDTAGLRRTLALFALLALLPAFPAVFPAAWPHPGEPGIPGGLFAESSGWLAALVLFFYAPMEASLSLWVFTLLAERGRDEREAGRVLVGFWSAFVGSRLLAALAQHAGWLTEGWDRFLIVLPPLLAAVLVGNLAGASHRVRPRLGMVLLGLLLGPVLPTLLALLFRHVAPAEQGLAYGAVFAAGTVGGLAFSPLLTVRTRPPLQGALRLPIFLALLVTAVALMLGLMTP